MYGRHQYKQGYTCAQQEYQVQVARANEQARRQEQQAQKRVNEITERLKNEIEQKDAAISAAKADAKRLRDQIRHSIRVSKSASIHTASNAQATRGWALFSECVGEYQAMGKVADEQLEELRQWQGYGAAMK